ncbi:MAG: tRNA (N(6)-L-threonylcarbamoyladenosine(37)-C(2))-methylthiotransferase MtaB [Eggerthellaceae bacterium]|nr:tRNA (N(6)-L-threonylcarbamoyladenosine(37)-C(2))-methylthiotransferase MtaB [Eggerthellaceae bacterium]
MPSTSFHIVNLGCKVNRVEADSMHAALMAKGAAYAQEEAADLIIVNTCTVTAEADKKARKAVHHALAVNPLAKVVVTGCAAAISQDVFNAMSPRVRVASKLELEMEFSEGRQEPLLRIGDEFRTRVGLKVQDGCDHACTYCIVHVARGKARSVGVQDVVREARAYLQAGVKEIVLTGIDIGAYQDGTTRLPELVALLLKEADEAHSGDEAPARIRISSIEPRSIDDELIELLVAADGRLCRHLHVPLQSGSSKVLREMDRPYTAEEYRALVQKIRSRVPSIALSTDVIVGFPGETDEDFDETCKLVKDCGFMRLHVFPYSRREGTPAADRPDQVDSAVKKSRAATLRDIGSDLARSDLESRKGRLEYCLVEEATCLSESYHEMEAPTGCKPGELVQLAL